MIHFRRGGYRPVANAMILDDSTGSKVCKILLLCLAVTLLSCGSSAQRADGTSHGDVAADTMDILRDLSTDAKPGDDLSDLISTEDGLKDGRGDKMEETGISEDVSPEDLSAGDGFGEDTLPEDAIPDGDVSADFNSKKSSMFGWITPTPNPQWLIDAPTCVADDLTAKYLRYRIRLRGDDTPLFPGFVSIGPKPGESMPASMRNPQAVCESDWWMNDGGCVQLHAPNSMGKLGWGDGTIWLGWYLATLATEYPVFVSLGYDTATTVEALYYALQAFNRLDLTAETHYTDDNGNPVQAALDGFFQRDDVPPEIIYHEDGSFRFPRDEVLPSGDVIQGYGCVSSATACSEPGEEEQWIEGGFFVSQDQIIGMLLGLALTWKLIPDDVQFNGVYLKAEAKAIVHRMVWHVRSNNWKITDPNGNHPPDEWGGSAVPYSNQIAKVANTVCGTDFGVDDYRDIISKTEGQTIWAALVASWDLQTGSNISMALKLASLIVDPDHPEEGQWDQDTLDKRAVNWGTPVFAFIYAIMHDLDTVSDWVSFWEVESMLTTAPCDGPCHLTAGCEEAPGWKGEHRWKSPEQRNGNKYAPVAQYGGMDYMILYNLYYIYTEGRMALTLPDLPVKKCDTFPSLQKLIDGTAGTVTTYDPLDPCALADLKKSFCGRKWASWLDAASNGDATLFVGGYQWSCTSGDPCVLTPAGKTGTDGTDLFIGTPADEEFDAKDGHDCLYGFGGNDILDGGNGREEIYGGDGNDELYGKDENDVIFGDLGDDRIEGGGGKDDLFGGDGADTIYGGGDDDFIEGGPGNDYLHGDHTDINITGGKDFISGGTGDDELHGGPGDDNLYGDDGRDKLDGGAGDDSLVGAEGDDFLSGGAGGDTLWGENGDDRLCGGDGADYLNGGWSSQDGCRGQGPTQLWWTTDTVDGCGYEASATECKDSAFDAW